MHVSTLTIVIAGVVLLANTFGFMAIAWDSYLKKHNLQRISDGWLLVPAVFCGWIGTLAGMQIFNLKKHNKEYKNYLVALVALNIAIVIGIIIPIFNM